MLSKNLLSDGGRGGQIKTGINVEVIRSLQGPDQLSRAEGVQDGIAGRMRRLVCLQIQTLYLL